MSSHPPHSAPSLPRRDRLAIIAGLAGATILSWAYLLDMAHGMQSMPDMGEMMTVRAWSFTNFMLMFLMWAVMMVGMMLPSATPMILMYAAVSRKAAQQGTPITPTAAFTAGYLITWTAFSLGATFAQWGLERAALLSPMMVSTSPLLGAGILAAAGLYQLSPAKNACLDHCRAPAHFIAQHWRPGFGGALQMGTVHGAYCLGCCWVLMMLLFIGGVMNLLWVAGITIFVLLEKVVPAGAQTRRVAGVGLLLTAAIVVFGSLL